MEVLNDAQCLYFSFENSVESQLKNLRSPTEHDAETANFFVLTFILSHFISTYQLTECSELISKSYRRGGYRVVHTSYAIMKIYLLWKVIFVTPLVKGHSR